MDKEALLETLLNLGRKCQWQEELSLKKKLFPWLLISQLNYPPTENCVL